MRVSSELANAQDVAAACTSFSHTTQHMRHTHRQATHLNHVPHDRPGSVPADAGRVQADVCEPAGWLLQADVCRRSLGVIWALIALLLQRHHLCCCLDTHGDKGWRALKVGRPADALRLLLFLGFLLLSDDDVHDGQQAWVVCRCHAAAVGKGRACRGGNVVALFGVAAAQNKSRMDVSVRTGWCRQNPSDGPDKQQPPRTQQGLKHSAGQLHPRAPGWQPPTCACQSPTCQATPDAVPGGRASGTQAAPPPAAVRSQTRAATRCVTSTRPGCQRPASVLPGAVGPPPARWTRPPEHRPAFWVRGVCRTTE